MSVTKWFSYRRPAAEEIPCGWEVKQLRQMATFVGGGRLDFTMSDYVADGFDAYSAEGCNGKLSIAEFDGPAVIVSSIGSLCGKSFLANGKFTTLANVQVVFPDLTQIDPYFLWLLLNDQDFWVRDQTGQPFIRPSEVKKAWIPKPPKPEQEALRAVFENIGSLVAMTREGIAKTEHLQRGLMQQFLTGRLQPDGTQRKTEEFVADKQFGLIPRSWRSCKFKDLVREGAIIAIQDGNHGEKHPRQDDYVETGIPFIMACDISTGHLDLENANKIPKELADNLRIGFSIKDDVLLSHKASIGFTAIVGDVSPYIMLTPQVTYYRCNPQLLLPRFLHLFFRSFRFQRVLDAFSAQSTRNYIGITNQKKLPILYPPDVDEQAAIAASLGQLDDLVQSKRAKIVALQRLKKSLMQNLLTGRVRLPLNDSALEVTR